MSEVPPGKGESGRATSRALDDHDVRIIVQRNYWAVLGTVGPDGQPYAVPIIYGYDGAFHAVVRDGRKVRNLEANPRASLTITEVANAAKQWRSVVALGRVEWIDDDDAMRAAIAVIRAQYPAAPTRSSGSMEALRTQGFRVLRLVVDEMTGRATGD